MQKPSRTTIEGLGLNRETIEKIHADEAKIANERDSISCSYVHPINTVTSRHIQYELSNADDKYKKVGTTKGNTYLKVDEKKRDPKHDICPICFGSALYGCDCEWFDNKCSNGHTWYLKDGETTIGDPHIDDSDDSGSE